MIFIDIVDTATENHFGYCCSSLQNVKKTLEKFLVELLPHEHDGEELYSLIKTIQSAVFLSQIQIYLDEFFEGWDMFFKLTEIKRAEKFVLMM